MAAQGTPQVVLVGGDAGIGKTTLVADLERRAGELGFTVATGHCLDLEAGISFAPVVEAVRSLLGGVDDLESRPSARRMLTLLDPEAPRSREAFHVLDDLTAVVLEAAAAGPVLVVLEDMHWADRSTQDFAATLSRTARGRLLLVLTFRSDELHRRHPFRKTLTEISRTPGSRRIDLGRVGPRQHRRASSPPTPTGRPTRRWSILCWRGPRATRCTPRSSWPPTRPEKGSRVTSRICCWPGSTPSTQGPRALLRLASVNGTRLDTETLAELAGLDQAQMEGYLREALDANVLRQTGDSLEFRHPLLREAAYDDLMPDERTRIHGRLAEILQARVDAEADPGVAALSRLAFHWNAAHDLPRTLSASVRAGLAAKRLAAAEAITQLERALSLWDRVPDAEAVAGHPRAELVLLLGEAATEQGDEERGYALVRTAVDMLGPDPDRLLASRVYSALGVADVPEAMVGRQEAIRRAVEYAGDSPTEELALALIAQSQYLYRHNHFAYSLEAAQRAIDAARSAGCVEAELDALWWECLSRAFLGHTGEALAGAGAGRSGGPNSGHGRPRGRGHRSACHEIHGGRTGRSRRGRRA